jgi:NAD(P)-dependent dehydrogenase (short-subunit alcohol dehydrogenase family)
MRFQGQKIVVMGGSSGMGLATAKAAADEGARVVIASRSEEKLRQAKAQIQGSVEVLTANVRDEITMQSFFQGRGSGSGIRNKMPSMAPTKSDR